MAVGVKSDNEYTYYFYWVKEELDTEWTLYGIIRLPLDGRTLNKSSVFQEDLASTNLLREGYISNAYGRVASTKAWECWNSGVIRAYNPNTQQWDTQEKCSFNLGTYPEGEYIGLCTGQGSGNCTDRLPYSFQLELTGSAPLYSPDFPCYIKSKYSNLYVAPASAGQDVVQKAKRYWWNFVDAGDGYVYILTTDKTQAITISEILNGADLTLSSFSSGSDNQKWKIENISGVSYLYPKNALSMNMDIEGPSYLENAKIQIWTHNTSATQFQWTIC